MVFNKELLFIHIPKAGGTSCTDYLCQKLTTPIFSSSLKSTLEDWHFKARLIAGFSHETLAEAYGDYQRTLALSGIDVRHIPHVVAVIRHPFNLELSIYNFYRNGRNNVLQAKPFRVPEVQEKIELAQGPIKNFVECSGYFRSNGDDSGYRTEDFLMIDGKLPENLHILRAEELDTTFTHLICRLTGLPASDFPRANVTANPKKATIDDLDPGARDAIYRKHQWLFDQGYYSLEPGSAGGL